jgi:hypothetical protein
MEHFLGEYQGVSIEDPSEIWLPADLDVSIQPDDNGFIMEWATVTKESNGKVDRQKNVVRFQSTKRHNVFASMKRDVFGGWVPFNPFTGDPFLWARYLDSTLTVYAMIIMDTGAHDMQIYRYTLTLGGLSINFKRVRNEESLQVVNGILQRVK